MFWFALLLVNINTFLKLPIFTNLNKWNNNLFFFFFNLLVYFCWTNLQNRNPLYILRVLPQARLPEKQRNRTWNMVDAIHNIQLWDTLTHCGLLIPNGDRDLGQHWLRLWLNHCLMAQSHHLNLCWLLIKGILWASNWEQFYKRCSWTCNVCLNITLLELLPHFPAANEYIFSCITGN